MHQLPPFLTASLLVLFCLAAGTAQAQDAPNPREEAPTKEAPTPVDRALKGEPSAAVDATVPASESPEALRLHLPLLDAPYNIANGLRAPSMAQSLELSAGAYALAHWGIGQGAKAIAGDTRWLEEMIAWPLIVFVDATLGLLPPFNGWLHEEWHRATMGNRNIDSFNTLYRILTGALSPFETLYAVAKVEDLDLARLKQEHPAEMVRLMMAGDESLAALADAVQADTFFYSDQSNIVGPVQFSSRRNTGLYGMLWFSHFLYLNAVTSGDLDAEIDRLIPQEPRVAQRDFTGPDFSAWAYDLFRPLTPYAARGTHPLGGVQRYIRFKDLAPEEQKFLKLQQTLHLINLANPVFFAIDAFVVSSDDLNPPLRFNIHAFHALTPFGYDIGASLLLSTPDWNLTSRFHTFINNELALPGFELTILDIPLTLAGLNLSLTPELHLWLQPDQLLFRSTDPLPGALLGLEVAFPLFNDFNAFIEVQGKTEGFVTGVEALDPALSARLGLEWIIR